MRWLRPISAMLVCLLASATFAQMQGNAWLETAARAVQNSKLTLPGSRPFHLRAEVIEVGEPGSDYQAKIEEYWASPEKWRRTIGSPAFSQTLIANGASTMEKDDGDYYPIWLSQIITSIFELAPDLEPSNGSAINPLKNLNPALATVCTSVDTQSHRWHFCFDPHRILLTSVFDLSTGYDAEFKNFKEFAKKQVPRQISFDPEPGTKIQTTITELSELRDPDEQLFAVPTPTLATDQIKTVRIDEATFRKLALTSTEIQWPPTGGGLAKGGCAVYASADRTGHIREVWPGGCDNTGLQTPLRDMVRKWQLRPATSNGVPVQVATRLTFAFETKVGPDPTPVLSDSEARRLATKIVEPHFPPNSGDPGTRVTVRISVDELGRLSGCDNPNKLPGAVFLTLYRTLSQWQFSPYVKDGKPQSFHADITFQIK